MSERVRGDLCASVCRGVCACMCVCRAVHVCMCVRVCVVGL